MWIEKKPASYLPFMLSASMRMDTLQFRTCFVEGNGPSFPERHLSTSVYYLWFLRQVAAFYGCEPTEDAVLATRNSMSSDALLECLLIILLNKFCTIQRIPFTGCKDQKCRGTSKLGLT